jgi:hypothetical protein
VFAETTRAIGEYVGKEFGHEMKLLVTQGKETSFSVPDLPDKATKQQELMWGKDYDLYLKKKNQYAEQKAKVFTIVLGQCDETMRNRVETQCATFQQHEEECNVVALLDVIKECAFNSNDKQYPPRQAGMALKQLLTMHQHEDETLVAFYKRFIEVCERVERMYGDMIPSVIVSKDGGKDKKEVKGLNAKNKMLATLFMEGENRGFKPMLRDLDNNFALGAPIYPESPEEALQVMMVYETNPIYKSIIKKLRKKKRPSDEDELQHGSSFMNKAEMMKKGVCFKCGTKGHKAADCTTESTKNTDDDNQSPHSWGMSQK